TPTSEYPGALALGSCRLRTSSAAGCLESGRAVIPASPASRAADSGVSGARRGAAGPSGCSEETQVSLQSRWEE
ncbi:hypothetical protein P7K49_005248, partial [Saguinus oedipus]